MNAKQLIVTGILGTVLAFAGRTQALAAVYHHRPIVHRPGYGAYWHRPYAYGYAPVYTYETPVYDTYAPCYSNGVYVGVPGVNFRIWR